MTDDLDLTEPAIDARPTKSFFIDMLTKDIALTRAVIDLADNSVDAARGIVGAEAKLDKFEVHIEASTDRFRIRDNCGGIDVDVARQYAFRFGRPEGMPTVKGSVGQFGVGMKRSLFKLGGQFQIVSRTVSGRFLVDVNVADWERNEDRWGFDFAELDEDAELSDGEEAGTEILVTKLRESVARDFDSDIFLNQLRIELTAALEPSISRGLILTLNGVRVDIDPMSLLRSSSIKPGHERFDLSDIGAPGVRVSLFAGLAESSPRDAGWNVYCNGRLVLDSDRTSVTVWGETESERIPQFHNQFARVRGYAFFDADDAGLLPWNTTKTGVDTDAPAYKYTRERMIQLTRPVIDFLNQLKNEDVDATDEEAEGLEPRRPLQRQIDAAAPAVVAGLRRQGPFTAPERPRSAAPRVRTVQIQYPRPTNKVQAAKRVLRVRSAKQVGERTFDYFYDHEVEQ